MMYNSLLNIFLDTVIFRLRKNNYEFIFIINIVLLLNSQNLVKKYFYIYLKSRGNYQIVNKVDIFCKYIRTMYGFFINCFKSNQHILIYVDFTV